MPSVHFYLHLIVYHFLFFYRRFPTQKTIVEKEQTKAEMKERGETYTAVKNWNSVDRSAKSRTSLNKEGLLSDASQSSININPHAPVNTQDDTSDGRRRVKRGGRTKRKRPARTDQENNETEEDPEHSFVKMKKFSGLGKIFYPSVAYTNADLLV